MKKNIVKDVLFLGQKSEEATPEDRTLALDLQDTLNAHLLECVGLAANMIGVKSGRLLSEWEVKIWSCLIRFSLKRKSLTKQKKDACPWWGVGRPLVMRRF